MKRKATALALLTALSGCAGVDRTGPPQMMSARPVAGMQGPYGEPVQAVAARLPSNNGIVQASAMSPATATDPNIVQAKFGGQKGGAGAMGMPAPIPGAVAAVGALPGIPLAPGMMGRGARSSIRFTSPAGMQIAWLAPSPDGRSGFSPTQVSVPGRYNFVQGGVYRLKLSNLPSRPDIELYPTLEVYPAMCRTSTFLAHSTVPVAFTEEDFEQVAAGNLVVKVIYLPDPQFQDLAVAGPDEVVSTRLEPGVDPIMEATRRGSILAVVRMGNIDLEDRNTPAMNAPPMGGPFQGMPLMPAPGALLPGSLPPGAIPHGSMPPGGIPPGALPPRAMPPVPAPPVAAPPGGIPQGTLPMPQTAVPTTNPGRATIGNPPTVTIPDAGTMAPSSGSVTVSADAMFGKLK